MNRLAVLALVALVLVAHVDAAARRRRKQRRAPAARPTPIPQVYVPKQTASQTPIDASLFYNPHPLLKDLYDPDAEPRVENCTVDSCQNGGVCILYPEVNVIDGVLPKHNGQPYSRETEHLERPGSKTAEFYEEQAGPAQGNGFEHHGDPTGPYYPPVNTLALCRCPIGFTGESCEIDISNSVYLKPASNAPSYKKSSKKSKKATKKAKKDAERIANRTPLGTVTVADYLEEKESLMNDGYLYIQNKAKGTTYDSNAPFPGAPAGNPQGLPQGYPPSVPSVNGAPPSKNAEQPALSFPGDDGSIALLPSYNPPQDSKKYGYSHPY